MSLEQNGPQCLWPSKRKESLLCHIDDTKPRFKQSCPKDAIFSHLLRQTRGTYTEDLFKPGYP